MDRPLLVLDLLGEEGNIFVVIPRARALLSGEALTNFNRELGMATLLDTSKKYRDILAIVNKYVRLIDKSGLFSEYAVSQDEVMAAIATFNEQLKALPDTVICAIDGLYPDFDNPQLGASVYLSFVDDEVRWTISILGQRKDEGYERLLTMLQECASALRRAGIE